MKCFYVYILCDQPLGRFYVGVTSNLVKRVFEHRSKDIEGYTKRHGITRLVYFEIHDEIEEAIKREKLLKRWKRR